ncbi:MAG: hypothetical protein ABI480_14125 [Chitinophagaceae bacterium]
MKKSIFFLGILFAFAGPVMAQDSLVIPKGVVYKKASDELNKEIKELLMKELSAKTVTYSLFDGVVFLGPGTWKQYKQNEKIGAIQQGNITFNVPIKDTVTGKTQTFKLEGKLIQNKADFKLVWDEIIKDFSSGAPIQIRKLKSRELVYYWSIISFDIVEPIYAVENGTHTIIMDSGGQKKLIFIEAL